MENIADALKIALAVFVFALAFTVLFNTASLARRTAEEAVIGADRTEYYTYLEDSDNSLVATTDPREGAVIINRKVTLEDIIPTIYRYSIESYGVTIIDEHGEIVTRFDRDTENLASTFNSTTTDEKQKLIREINAYVLNPVGATEIKGGGDNVSDGEINNPGVDHSLAWLFKNIYEQEIELISGTNRDKYDRREFDCPWQSAVTGADGWIAQRIDSDLSGYQVWFDLAKPGIQSEEENAKNHKPCVDEGIIKKYTQNGKSRIFKEFMITHDINRPTRDDENGDLYYIEEGSGTVRNAIKREIIYVATSDFED